jgi:hypothetical protein
MSEEPTESDGVDVLIEDDGERDCQIGDVETLCTNIKGEDFESICY